MSATVRFKPGDAESFVAAHFPDAKAHGRDRWQDCCPAHPDKSPSLSIGQGEKGITLYCHAGCTFDAICNELGVPKSAMFYPNTNGNGSTNGNSNGHAPASVKRTEYLYRDEHGNPHIRRTRVDYADGNKKVFQDRNEGGRWVSGLGDTRRVLYRLPELLSADPWELVFVVEGEKCADALSQHGLTVTTSGSSDSWRDEFADYFTGRSVVILPDNDAPGREYAQTVARSVARVASYVAVVELPDLPHKGDVYDFLEAGHTLAELRELAAGAPEWTPNVDEAAATPIPAPPVAAPGGPWPCTDMGNAERLIARHGHDIRYCHAWKRFVVWDGRRWKPDDTGEVTRRAKQTVRAIYAEAAAVVGDDDESKALRRALAGWAVRSENRSRLEAMIALAASEHGVSVTPDELDRDPWKLTCLNGTLDLRTGHLHPHNRADMITRLAPVEYDPAATCPTFDAFLARIFANRRTVIDFVRKATGYSMTGDTSERAMFILHGTGANGKSTLVETLAAGLGDYALTTPAETLMVKRDSSIPNDVARLRGARFVTAAESEEGRRLAESLVKRLTGGTDQVSARFLHAEFFDFKPVGKYWLSTNHKPSIRGTDDAIWSRIRLIPFDVTIPPAEQDKRLPAKLKDELPGVFAWMVAGCLAWLRDGLDAPAEVAAASAAYRAEQDVLAGWLAECCEQNADAWTSARAAFDSFKDYANDNRITQTEFGKRLREKEFAPKRQNNVRGWAGFELLDAEAGTRLLPGTR